MNEPGSTDGENFKSGFKQRLNDLCKELFTNEPEVIQHFGGESFIKLMDEVTDKFRILVIKLISMPKENILAGVKKEDAFRYLETTVSINKSQFFQQAKTKRDPNYSMISDEDINQLENELYDILKSMTTFYIR